MDAISKALDRDCSWVLGKAVDRYLEAHRWQVEHITEGLCLANEGRFAKLSEIQKAFAELRK